MTGTHPAHILPHVPEYRKKGDRILGPYGPYLKKRPDVPASKYRPRKKLVSRQRAYQLKMKRLGKCKICGRKRGVNAELCDFCLSKGAGPPPTDTISA